MTLHLCGHTPWRNTWKCKLKFDIEIIQAMQIMIINIFHGAACEEKHPFRSFDQVQIRLWFSPPLRPPLHNLASGTSSSSRTSLSLSTTSYLLCPIVFWQILNLNQDFWKDLLGGPFGPPNKSIKKVKVNLARKCWFKMHFKSEPIFIDFDANFLIIYSWAYLIKSMPTIIGFVPTYIWANFHWFPDIFY